MSGSKLTARRAACITLVLILILLVIQSARMGMAGLMVGIGQEEVDHWTSSRQSLGIDQINRIAARFADSLDYMPDNPWALENLAALDLARMRLSAEPRKALAYTREARLRLRNALEQRPTSPFLWANMVMSKLYLDEIDDEFLSALRNTNELGPWQPLTQQTVVFAGLAAWTRLDEDLRQMVTRALGRGASRDGERMLAIVRGFRRLDLVCSMQAYDVISGADCRNAATAAKPRTSTRKGNY